MEFKFVNSLLHLILFLFLNFKETTEDKTSQKSKSYQKNFVSRDNPSSNKSYSQADNKVDGVKGDYIYEPQDEDNSNSDVGKLEFIYQLQSILILDFSVLSRSTLHPTRI